MLFCVVLPREPPSGLHYCRQHGLHEVLDGLVLHGGRVTASGVTVDSSDSPMTHACVTRVGESFCLDAHVRQM